MKKSIFDEQFFVAALAGGVSTALIQPNSLWVALGIGIVAGLIVGLLYWLIEPNDDQNINN